MSKVPDEGDDRAPRRPYMTNLVVMAWQRVGRSGGKYEFACYCRVCTGLRAKTKEPE